MLLLAAGGTVAMFLLLFVLPRFAGVFDGLGRDLPWASRALMQLGVAAAAHPAMAWALALGVPVAAALAWTQPAVRQGAVQIAWALPGLGARLRTVALARLYRCVGLLAQAGVPVPAALRLAEGVLSGPLQPALRSAAAEVETGQRLSAAWQWHGLATPVALRMLRVGEGSGTTTTLYAAITETASTQEKVVTIEDPVEYRLPGVVQIPVNERKGLTFARGLRSILRHDPDRVLVGEIRDPETAQIAVQAALTGHLVFSTVQANNALNVIGRFMHMGLDPYNTVAALNAVFAQRLLRVLCDRCAARDLQAGESPARLRAVGCTHCRGTGYRGRRAVAELLRLDDELRDLIAARAPMSRIKQRARERGMRPLRDAALDAVREGWTTIEEVERVTADA
jgi:hypothetical protein